MVALAASARLDEGANTFDALLVLLGAGMGLVMPNMTTTIQNAAKPAELGVAMATTSFFRSLGGAFGVALAGMLLSLTVGVQGSGAQTVSALKPAAVAAYGDAVALIFAVFAGVLVLALLVTLATPAVALRRK